MSTSETVIKISYNGSLRNVPLTSEEQISWDAFETKIRTLFTIPDSTALTVNYVDSDGDRIIFDTDQELAELFRGVGRPSKLFVTGKDSTPVPPTASTATAEEKGKARQEAPPTEKQPPNKNPLEEFIEKVDPIMKELNEELKKSNIGPILEKIASEAQAAFSARGGPSCGGPWKRSSSSAESAFDPFAHAAFHKRRFYGHCNPFQTTNAQAEYPPRWNTVTCDGCNAKGFQGTRHKCKTCDDFDLCGDCYGRATDIHNAQHEFEEITHPLVERETEALEALWGMGFAVEEEKARDLLRRYHGNLDRVVEVLLREASTLVSTENSNATAAV
ncbi:E3 ubiquitin-protein ligase kcmf1 [Rhizoclosmatium hyalinum]|nr:E3 ubiquitin-protein ligase kcmf1 [Rhizoclosmatium hyalinum]